MTTVDHGADGDDNSHGEAGSQSGGYRVGYGKPPIETRFEKGKSGNPKGRPRKKRDADRPSVDPDEHPAQVYRRVMGEEVRSRSGDKINQMTAWEGVLRKLRAKAFEGDRGALRDLISLGRLLGYIGAAPSEHDGGGVLVVPGIASDPEEWARQASLNQAKYRSNMGDADPC